MHFIEKLLSPVAMTELVSEMRRTGYNVESTPLGYICREQVKHGTVCVLSALRSKTRGNYLVKLHTAFFDTGRPQSVALH
jgi:hypothetical protein